MNDLQLFIALGAAQIVMAVWGGILAVKSLPTGARKLPHVWGFIVLGVIGIAVTVAIGISNDRSANEAKRTQTDTKKSLDDANSKLDIAHQDTSRMGGQLTALGELVKRSHDPNIREWADAVNRVIQESKTPSAQLIDQAKSDAKQLGLWASMWHQQEESSNFERRQFPERAEEIKAKMDEVERKWCDQIRPLTTSANSVREELLQRSPSKPTDGDNIAAAIFLKSVTGERISDAELDTASRYLNALAEQAAAQTKR